VAHAPLARIPPARNAALRGRRRAAAGDRPAATGCRVGLVRGIAAAEAATVAGLRLLLRLAIDYSARDAVLRAAAVRTVGYGAVAGVVSDASSPSWTTGRRCRRSI